MQIITSVVFHQVFLNEMKVSKTSFRYTQPSLRQTERYSSLKTTMTSVLADGDNVVCIMLNPHRRVPVTAAKTCSSFFDKWVIPINRFRVRGLQEYDEKHIKATTHISVGGFDLPNLDLAQGSLFSQGAFSSTVCENDLDWYSSAATLSERSTYAPDSVLHS